jgi:hypothetical protein
MSWHCREFDITDQARAFAKSRTAEGYEVERYHYHVYWRVSVCMRETVFSVCRTYRYTLWREWDMCNSRYLQVIALNPSVADETQDDPTVRRCIDYATRWGYGALCMTNLFALRSTNPRRLFGDNDPIGEENDQWLATVATGAGGILVAWGTHGTYQRRDEAVTRLLQPRPLLCLGQNTDGTPKHPLYMRKAQGPLAYPGGRRYAE